MNGASKRSIILLRMIVCKKVWKLKSETKLFILTRTALQGFIVTAIMKYRVDEMAKMTNNNQIMIQSQNLIVKAKKVTLTMMKKKTRLQIFNKYQTSFKVILIISRRMKLSLTRQSWKLIKVLKQCLKTRETSLSLMKKMIQNGNRRRERRQLRPQLQEEEELGFQAIQKYRSTSKP